jgi:hypothetical protein
VSTIRHHPVISWSVVWAGSVLVESARYAYTDSSLALGLIGTVSFVISSLALVYLGVRGIRRKTHVGLRNVVVGVAVVAGLAFIFQRAMEHGIRTQIEDTITAAFTSTNPSFCYDDVTWTYLEQLTHQRRPFSDDACAQSLGQESRARAVEISDINPDGGKATATVAPTGGTFDGSRLKVQLDHEDRWRVDRIIRFVSFDRAGYEATQRALLSAPGMGYQPRSVDCVIGRERTLPDSEVEQVLLGGSEAGQLRLLISCDRQGFERLLTRHFADPRFRDFPPTILSCVRRDIAEASPDRLISYDTDLQAWGEFLVGCDRPAWLRYYRGELLNQGRSTATADCVIAGFAKLSNSAIARETADAEAFDGLLSRCESNT